MIQLARLRFLKFTAMQDVRFLKFMAMQDGILIQITENYYKYHC